MVGELEPEALRFPRRKQGLSKEVGRWFSGLLEARDYGTALRRVREFKQVEMLRIAARDLARLGRVPEITQEISDVADVCLQSVWQSCRQQLAERYGQPYHQDANGRWQPTAGCVLGLGKLGGQELNYSSDVDVIFFYSEEGSVFKEPPGKGKTPRPVLTQPSVFQSPGRGVYCGSNADDGGRHAVPDRRAPAAGRRCRSAEPVAGKLRELLRPVGPNLGTDDADQSAAEWQARKRWRRSFWR